MSKKKQLTFDFKTNVEGLPLDRQDRIKELCDRLEIDSFTKIQDGFMSALAGHPTLDIFKLERILEQRFGSLDKNGYSIDEVLEREYGTRTVKLTDSLII